MHAAVEARGDSGLVIIGRTDSRASHGLDDAIKRGRAYFEAGADIVFIEAPQGVEELKEIAGAFEDAPLFANMVEGGKTPFLSTKELEQLGYKIVVYPLSGLFSATRAIEACFNHLKENGTTQGFEEMLKFKDFEEVINTAKYREIESKFKTSL
jgi:methylisocitrate lyase